MPYVGLHFLRCENETALAIVDKKQKERKIALKERKGEAMEYYLMFLASTLLLCIFFMAFSLIYSPKPEITTETTEATPGMDKQKECCKLGDTNRKNPIVYVACEVKMSYDTDIVGVFSTLEAAEKYCEYKRIVGGDSFFYAEAHGVDEKHIPSEVGIQIIKNGDDEGDYVDFFDLEKHTEWDEDDNENVIRGMISYSGESIEKLRHMARFMKDTVVK